MHYREIGHVEVIAKRHQRTIPIDPGGVLSDYVPFYFTPKSMMLYNIVTGYNGVRMVPREEIVFFVSTLHRVREQGRPFVFSDRHALSQIATLHNELTQLDCIDWNLLRSGDFSRDEEDPGKTERYQAEALVWKHVPLAAIGGLVCFNAAAKQEVQTMLDDAGLSLPVEAQPRWYFDRGSRS